MRAVVFEQFGGPLRLERVDRPSPPDDGVVIDVKAVGVCRSDWHGWQGHDPDIKRLPHVPGHELAGVVAETGRQVRKCRSGDRVTMPFVAGCGDCPECRAGAAQVCDRQYQPGFKAWGAFAEAVAVRFADFNLVRLPDDMEYATAASLGCRLATAYRAVALQGGVRPGNWVAVHGCGGLGLSAVMVAAALGARVVAVDVQHEALDLAAQLGAVCTLNATGVDDVAAVIQQITSRGADVSLDALGSGATAANSLRCLRKRGRHVQAGLLVGHDAQPRLPMELVVGRELQIYGTHGLAAADYGPLLAMIRCGQLCPQRLVRRRIALDEAPAALAEAGRFAQAGITIIELPD
ncbi:MAG: alcohol dehydrogenase [Planctomycetota bacterium]|nr:MAG: alcohol dehydrogenase [Planctomycetota bacterium]